MGVMPLTFCTKIEVCSTPYAHASACRGSKMTDEEIEELLLLLIKFALKNEPQKHEDRSRLYEFKKRLEALPK